MSESGMVHVIDDDASLRTALESLFRSVGLDSRSYESPQQFLDAERPDRPGCLVLDVRLPGISGLDFQEHLAEHNISLPVVLMTGYGDIPMSVRGMKAGAMDFLTKPFRDQDMLDAVFAAIGQDRVRQETQRTQRDLEDRYARLSPRERQVMGLVTAGLMNKQVAHELGLSEITVKIHRGAAMRKMRAKTLADLVRMAERLHVAGDHAQTNV